MSSDMSPSTVEKIKERYNNLQTAVAKFANGSLSSNELKKFTAPLGIYEQKNGKFMMRIRIPGGELSTEQTRFIIRTANKFSIENLHLTTRQDLQMHDLSVQSLTPIVREFLEFGMPFYGGGADTFRNVTACPFGLFDSESVFDTVPYAQALTDFLMDYDKAFDLPRKFKIAFSCDDNDFSMARFNDLGFVAKFANGKRGFEVYAGGGMGRESRTGVRIFDFVEDTEIFRIAVAAMNMFYELGNRQDRARARFRFILIEKGEEFFKTQFLKYLDQVHSILPPPILFHSKKSDGQFVRLFIPNGNLKTEQFAKIAENAEKNGAQLLRFSQEQDVYVGFFNDINAKIFRNQFPEFSGESLFGLVKSCVGAKVCKIGILDAQSHAQAVSEKLNELIASLPEETRRKAIEKISALIKISGCHNSCGLNRVVKYGFQGAKKNIDGKIFEFYRLQMNGSKTEGVLAKDDNSEIPVSELPDFVVECLKNVVFAFCPCKYSLK